MTFERDLGLWEAGRLSEPDLLARHPQDDPAFYVELHRRLTAAAAEPIADDETGWETLRARLPERVTSRQDWVGRWMARPLLAGVAVVALSGWRRSQPHPPFAQTSPKRCTLFRACSVPMMGAIRR